MGIDRSLIRTGYDFAESLKFKTRGAVEDMSAATIKISLKNVDKSVELIAETTQTNDGDADWANGVVVLRFPKASTDDAIVVANPGDAWIEVLVIKSGIYLPYPDIPATIEIGYAV